MVIEEHKKPGVCYAFSDEGWELPVIDVTHQAFACEPTAGQLATASAATLQTVREAQRLPLFLRRFIAHHTALGRDFDSAYMSGMTTYLQKLGPDNLGRGYTRTLDRKTANLLGPLAMRLRLKAMARLLAEHVCLMMAARAGAPLHLINIAGGAAPDSLNALLVLHQEHPQCLASHPIHVYVFDLDAAAPRFGARALEALRAPGAPLHDLDITLIHTKYDWLDVFPLRELLKEIHHEHAIVAASSEGGLFEYGTDTEIIANLKTLLPAHSRGRRNRRFGTP